MTIEETLREQLDAAHENRLRMEARLDAAFRVISQHHLLEELATLESKQEKRLAVLALETRRHCRTTTT